MLDPVAGFTAGTGWRCPGVAGRVACPAAGMTGDIPPARDRRDAPAAEAGEGELIEVTFSPAEPQLTPGAARAVLADAHARQGKDWPRRGLTHLKRAAESRYHGEPRTSRAGLWRPPISRQVSCHEEGESGEQNPLLRPDRRPQSRRLEGDPAALRADGLAAADPGIRIGATPAVFCGRAAHVTGARESRTGRHRQLTVCRAALAACGGCCPALKIPILAAFTMPMKNRAFRAVSWGRCRATWARCRTQGRFSAVVAVCGQAGAGNGAGGSAGRGHGQQPAAGQHVDPRPPAGVL